MQAPQDSASDTNIHNILIINMSGTNRRGRFGPRSMKTPIEHNRHGGKQACKAENTVNEVTTSKHWHWEIK